MESGINNFTAKAAADMAKMAKWKPTKITDSYIEYHRGDKIKRVISRIDCRSILHVKMIGDRIIDVQTQSIYGVENHSEWGQMIAEIKLNAQVSYLENLSGLPQPLAEALAEYLDLGFIESIFRV